MAKLLAIAFSFGLMGLAGASELWWCEGVSPTTANGAGLEGRVAMPFANKSGDRAGAGRAALGSAGARPTDLTRTKIDGHDSSTWSFLTELAASVGGEDDTAPQATPYADLSNVLSQVVVPEPTGGLLVLLGAMALGLRRKSDV